MTPVAIRGTTVHVVSPVAGGITVEVMGEVAGAIAGRANRQATWAATYWAADRIPCGTTDEVLRQITSQTALQTTCGAVPRTMYDTTVRVISWMIQGVVPHVGESFWPWPAQSLGFQRLNSPNLLPRYSTKL